MEIINFTKNKELYEHFKKVWEKDSYINIVGINSLGDEFDVLGKIATDDNGDMSVYEDCIFLAFGDKSNRALIAPYDTVNLDGENVMTGLFIKEIRDLKGDILFENPNFESIAKDAEKNAKKAKERDQQFGFDITEDDAVTEKLRGLIGRPIVLDEDGRRTYGVLSEVKGSSFDGRTVLCIRNSVLAGTAFVGDKTALFTIAFNGEEKFLADNALPSQALRTERVMSNRRIRIANKRESEAE